MCLFKINLLVDWTFCLSIMIEQLFGFFLFVCIWLPPKLGRYSFWLPVSVTGDIHIHSQNQVGSSRKTCCLLRKSLPLPFFVLYPCENAFHACSHHHNVFSSNELCSRFLLFLFFWEIWRQEPAFFFTFLPHWNCCNSILRTDNRHKMSGSVRAKHDRCGHTVCYGNVVETLQESGISF